MGIRTYGPNAVDWEERVDMDRLRSQRLERLKRWTVRSWAPCSALTFTTSAT